MLDEVAMLAASIAEHGEVLTVDPTVSDDLERSVSGARPGALIDVDAACFERLAAAYLAAIEARYS